MKPKISQIFFARSLMLITIISGCSLSIPPQHHSKNISHAPPFASSIEYFPNTDEAGSISLQLLDQNMRLKDIEKRLMLIARPEKNRLSPHDIAPHEDIVIKKTNVKDVVMLKPKQALLEQNHGLYYQDHNNDWMLLYVFKPTPSVKLINVQPRDMKSKPVDPRRIWFSFNFDQPVNFTKSVAMSFMSLQDDIPHPAIQTIFVDEKKTSVTIRLNEKQGLFPHARYQIFFHDSLRDAYARSIITKPIEFSTHGNTDEAAFYSPQPSLTTSSTSIDIKWLAPHEHYLELFFKSRREKHSSFTHVASQNVPHQLFFDGLISDTSYNYFLRSEDFRGQTHLVTGTFSTLTQPTLRITEIFADDTSQEAAASHTREFIEVTNIAGHDITIDQLSISVEDIYTRSMASCPVILREQQVPKDATFLITGSDFDENAQILDDNITIIRLKQKTLCRSLKSGTKIIKLHRNDNHFIDRFVISTIIKGKSHHRNHHRIHDDDSYCHHPPSPGIIDFPCDNMGRKN